MSILNVYTICLPGLSLCLYQCVRCIGICLCPVSHKRYCFIILLILSLVLVLLIIIVVIVNNYVYIDG